MTISHTPGPWFLTERHENSNFRSIHNAARNVTNVCVGGPNEHGDADGHLIAAGPELLAALIKARALIEKKCYARGHGDRYEARELYEALFHEMDGAIAKATDAT